MRKRLCVLITTALLYSCGNDDNRTENQTAVQGEKARPATIARLDSGQVRGVAVDGVIAFKGIPYAEPPVGDLRWAPPQPVKSWEGVRDATRYGADCMQKPFPSDAAPLGTDPAEDCLFINVWRSDRSDDDPMPVVVWIHGGGFVNGGSSPDVYDGSQYARKGVVFISFNYRLGRFGFFAHPALTAEDGGLANYALLDQLAAMQWVQRNAGAFGGDPGQVTIMGESAGGRSVTNLLSQADAQGTFHRAIVMSGGGRGPLMGQRLVSKPLGDSRPAEWFGLNLAEQYGIEGTGADALAALRALTAEQVTDGLNMASMRDQQTYAGGLVTDGAATNPEPIKALLDGDFARVPLLIGTTSMDIGFNFATSKDELFAGFGAAEEAARAAYDPQGAMDLQVLNFMFGADRMMHEPAHYLAGQYTAFEQPAWVYRFSYVAESMREEWPGAPHATDIPFFFNTISAKYGDALTDKDRQAGELSLQYFVNFIRSGNPNGAALPEWPQYDPNAPRILNISMDATADIGPDPLQLRLDIVKAMYGGKVHGRRQTQGDEHVLHGNSPAALCFERARINCN